MGEKGYSRRKGDSDSTSSNIAGIINVSLGEVFLNCYY
jgi:hypothetical protein